jgi:hypothetical protein
MENIVNKIENKDFFTLSLEDAEVIDQYLKTSNVCENAIEKTKNNIGDSHTIDDKPWFLPYLLITQYSRNLNLSQDLVKYLDENPVVPENQAANVPKDQVVKDKDESDEKEVIVETEPVDPQPPSKDDDTKKQAKSRRIRFKTEGEPQDIECFKIVMRFVSKPSIHLERYFANVVLPYMLKGNRRLESIVKSNSAGNNMDDILKSILDANQGAVLRDIGYDMIETVFRASSAKYGERRTKDLISKVLSNLNETQTIKVVYLHMFPQKPKELYMMLKMIKSSIGKFN